MKMKYPSHIDRRTFLKGAGVTLALPFMDSLALTANKKAAKKDAKQTGEVTPVEGLKQSPAGPAAAWDDDVDEGSTPITSSGAAASTLLGAAGDTAALTNGSSVTVISVGKAVGNDDVV